MLKNSKIATTNRYNTKARQTNISRPVNILKHSNNNASNVDKGMHIDQLVSSLRSKHSASKQIVVSKDGKRYFLGDFLGKGGFAKVYTCHRIDKHGYVYAHEEEMACKVVQKAKISKDHQKQKMALEIEIHSTLLHENIVRFFGHFEDSGCVYVVLELCQNRSLMELHKRRKIITEPEVRYYMKQFLSGLHHLHELQIIHRDLKLSNILLAKQMRVKLADFGLATKVNLKNASKRTTMCGTPNYIAPEILNRIGHGKPADVWSSGCIMFALLCGTPPFETESLKGTYERIKQNKYTLPSHLEDTASAQMIIAMLHPQQEKRPDVATLLVHAFIYRGYCPSSMPDSAMTTAPHFNDQQSICTYMSPKPERRNLIPRPLTSKPQTTHNPRLNLLEMQQLRDNLSRSPRQPVPSIPQLKSSPINYGHNSPEELFAAMARHAQRIIRQTSPFLKWANGSQYDPKFVSSTVNMEDAENPASRPVFWISKWVDYSDKYGLGYTLIDESVGVLFNDSFRLLLHKTQIHLQYIPPDIKSERLILITEVKPEDKNLVKKLKLLRHFRSYMEAQLQRCGEQHAPTEQENLSRLPYLIKWYRTQKAIVLMLSNGTVQINFFSCHTKLFFDPCVEAVTYIDEHKKMATYSIDDLLVTGIRTDVYQKIMYGRKLVETLHNYLRPDSGLTGKMMHIDEPTHRRQIKSHDT